MNKLIFLIIAVAFLLASCGSTKPCPAYSDANKEISTENKG